MKEELANEKVNTSSRQADQAGETGGNTPQISWDTGTAYDLFFSLYVLHLPEKFGLRASWAAGVRSRLTNEERKTLLDAHRVMHVPLCWIYSLPGPKDAETALFTLKQIPPEKRLPEIVFCDNSSREYQSYMSGITSRGKWDESDLETLKGFYKENKKEPPRSKEMQTILDVWANREDFGERYYKALQSYYRAFFAEEQRRIVPALREELRRAQALAGQLALPDLIEELSKGIRLQESLDVPELIFAPSYWLTPLIYFTKVSPDKLLILFGARPADASIVPGEQVPDPILHGLKALSDPTRLRILRYLTHENLTPAELARRLRLRAPTVTHHLRALRLAGLVHVTVGSDPTNRYTSRLESIDELCSQIKGFMKSETENSGGSI